MSLYPLLRQTRKDEKKAVLVKDKLFIDGIEVSADKKGSSDGHDEGDGANGATGGAAK